MLPCSGITTTADMPPDLTQLDAFARACRHHHSFSEGNPMARSMFAMMFDQYAERLQSAGIVRVDGDKVSLNATFRNADESVELNGERMPLMRFFMRLGQMF